MDTFLYAKGGFAAAEAEGRRRWFDRNTFQLSVVDTPANIERIARFLDSLPELRQQRSSKVIPLEYAVAEELATNLSQLLELSAPLAGGAAAGGDGVVRRMRRGDQFTFRDLRVRSVAVPMRRPLGTSTTKLATALLALFDLETEEGITGRAYAFGIGTSTAPLHGVVPDILAAIKGARAAPADIHAALERRFRLFGLQGHVAIAASCVDVVSASTTTRSIASMRCSRIAALSASSQRAASVMRPHPARHQGKPRRG